MRRGEESSQGCWRPQSDNLRGKDHPVVVVYGSLLLIPGFSFFLFFAFQVPTDDWHEYAMKHDVL